MLKAFGPFVALLMSVSSIYAQTTDPQTEGARQVVGLFAKTCLRFADDSAALRDFLKGMHVPELTPQGQAIFLRDRRGVGFDASNKVTRLAIVSEDNGVCTVFAGRADISQIAALTESAVKSRGLQLTQQGERGTGSALTHFYGVTINGRDFKPVVSVNLTPDAAIQTALTLSP